VLTLAYLRPEEGHIIWSKRRQGFQLCFEAGIREVPFLIHYLYANGVILLEECEFVQYKPLNVVLPDRFDIQDSIASNINKNIVIPALA